MIEKFTEIWDRNWIGEEVTLWLPGEDDVVRGVLMDYGKAYVQLERGARPMFLNPALIVAIIPPAAKS